nr:ISAs1 family transposase [Leptodesmis sichuanensis]
MVTHLQLSCSRLPSDSTIRRAMMRVDFTQLATAFTQWTAPLVEADEAGWFAVDGKALNGSIVAPCETHQQFINLVSVFSHARGLTVATDAYHSHQDSEMATVERLLGALNLEAVRYTLDAAHCQKNSQDHHPPGQRLSDLRQGQSKILVRASAGN